MKTNEPGFSKTIVLLIPLIFTVLLTILLYFHFQKKPNLENIKKMTSMGLTVAVGENAFGKKIKVVLSGAGYLKSNKFTTVDRYLLAVYPTEDHEVNGIELNEPIELEFDLNNHFFINTIRSCDYDLSTLSFYTNAVAKNKDYAVLDSIKKIDSKLDKKRNVLVGKLTKLGKYQQYGVFTDIIVGVKPNKYLLGCGNESKAYLEGNELIFKTDKYSLKLPVSIQRPLVSPGLINNRVYLFLKTREYPYIQLISQSNWQKLEIKDLDKLKHHAYEMMGPSAFFGDEIFIEKNLIQLGSRDFLEIISKDEDSQIYRLITTYNNLENVIVFESKMNEADFKKFSNEYVKLTKNIASTFREL